VEPSEPINPYNNPGTDQVIDMDFHSYAGNPLDIIQDDFGSDSFAEQMIFNVLFMVNSIYIYFQGILYFYSQSSFEFLLLLTVMLL
jgi:hypothetical protein